MQNTPLRDDLRSVFNNVFRIGAALGRKFEASDMTIELRQAASLYAANYQVRAEGDDFMRDMQNRVAIPGFLTDGQSKGVLNVLMADARRSARGPHAADDRPRRRPGSCWRRFLTGVTE